MKYFLMPFFVFLLIVFQTALSQLLFFGWLIVEISLIAVVYAGFYVPFMKGAIICFVLGFFLDCFTGAVSGLFVFSYVLIFLISRFVSQRVYAERSSFIMIFVGLCVLLEGLLVMVICKFAYGVGKFYHLWDVFLPQALIAGLLGPWFFKLFHKVEVLYDGGNTCSVKR
jgi:rod shape-determining protein MreD